MAPIPYSEATIQHIQATLGNSDWCLDNLFKIQTKQSKLITFKMNRIQREVHNFTKDYNRTMVLKSRQVGISTYYILKALYKVIFTRNTTAAIIAHSQDTLDLLFEIVNRAYENIPSVKFSEHHAPWEKPKADRQTLRMLRFAELDSKIYVDLSIRGGTVHHLHISEAAFIPNMDEVWAATQEAVPPQTGVISVESTANGMGNWFYHQWMSGDSWKKMFFPWFEYEDNRVNFPTDGPMSRFSCEYVMRTLTPEEKLLQAAYDLDEQQLAWHRLKMSAYHEGTQHLMKQENPATPEEAFVFASGRFYPEFKKEVHVLPDHEPPPGVNKYVSLDYGWTNPSSIGLWYVDYDGNCIRYKEKYEKHWAIPEQCAWLRTQGFDTVNFADPSLFANNQQKNGKIESLADEYRRHGVMLKRANNDKGAGFPRVRDYLRLRDGHKNPINGLSPAPTVYCTESCADSIREFLSIRYAKNPSDKAKNREASEDHEKTEDLSHAIDDWRYFLVSRPKIPSAAEVIPKEGTPAYRIWQWERRRKGGTTY